VTTPGPTTAAGRFRSALLVIALLAGVLLVLELIAGNLGYALAAAAVAFVAVIAGARPRGGT
jgi:hypothetical protein